MYISVSQYLQVVYICISIFPGCISLSQYLQDVYWYPNISRLYICILIVAGCINIIISISPRCMYLNISRLYIYLYLNISRLYICISISPGCISQYFQVVNCYSSRLSNYYKLHDCMRPKAYPVTLIQAVQTILGSQHQAL